MRINKPILTKHLGDEMGILANSPPQPDDRYTQQSSYNPPPQPDGRQTQPSPYECDFPEYIESVERGSPASPDTKFLLKGNFYQLMRRWLHNDTGQTVAASHLTVAAHDARSDPTSAAGALITNRFFRYLQDTCEDNLILWAQKDCEVLGDEGLWDYTCCTLSSKLGMRGTMLISDGGSYTRNGYPQPVIFITFRRLEEGHGIVYLDRQGEQRRRHDLTFCNRELLDLGRLGIDL